MEVWLCPLSRCDQCLIIEGISYWLGLDPKKTHIFADESTQAVADEYDRLFMLLALAVVPSQRVLFAPTVSSLSLNDTTDVRRFEAWFPI